MAVNLSPVGGVAAQFFDNDGNVLSGGKIYTYAAGTNTPQSTYTTGSGLVAHANPIVLDSAGRVPTGEIWLTDGSVYKFVIKDANDTLIGTYDNIVGINSNFVNYSSSQEIQTATAGQTVFTLTTMAYQPATNTLSVFVDGVNQYGPGAQYAYTETSSTSVTFASGLHKNASVKFTTAVINNAGGVDASQVTYDPPFAGSEVTNVEAKLAQTVSVKDYGAIGDGVANDTSAISTALSNLTNNSSLYFPAGVYLIDSQLSESISSLSGIKLYGDGAVIKLGVDQTSGNRLISFTNCQQVEIDGLTIDGDAYIANIWYFDGCSGVKYTNNTVEKLWRTSILVDGYGLIAENCQDVVISANSFHRTNKAIVFDDAGTTSTNVTITSNTITESGFGAIILPHRNSVISNNTVEFTGLGPFYRAYGSGTTITRSDMRNNAWVPAPVTADYGTGKGTAFNTGSNTLASGSYPYNLTITGNTFNQTAEYPMGVESGRFVSTVELAGPAEHITISGNTFEKSGTQHLYLTGVNGCSIVGNHFGSSALNGISTEAQVAVITRTVDASFSGRPAAEKIQNGNQNITITGNTFKDLSGNSGKGIYFDQANVERCINNISIVGNTFQFSLASAKGIQYDNTAGLTQPAFGIKVIGNTFINDVASVGGYISAWGVDQKYGVYESNSAYNMGSVVSLSRFINDNTNYVSDGGVNYPISMSPNASGTTWTSGAGSPEGVLTAVVGSLYTRTDGGANTTLYIKESGTGNTGWVAK